MKNIWKRSSSLIILTASLLTVLASNCGGDCKTCTKGKCLECKLGYGLKESECILCNRTNCLNCDGDEEDCSKCAPYHFREPMEGGKYHECTKCGFGCESCANKEKCVECGPMFVHSVIDSSNCIVNHAKLFIIMVVIMASLCVSSCLAFWCSPGAGEVSVKAKKIRELEDLIKEKNEMIIKLSQMPQNNHPLDTETARMRLESEGEGKEIELAKVKDEKEGDSGSDSSSSSEEEKSKNKKSSINSSSSEDSDNSKKSKKSAKKSKA